jgi:hypothetical protein
MGYQEANDIINFPRRRTDTLPMKPIDDPITCQKSEGVNDVTLSRNCVTLFHQL